MCEKENLRHRRKTENENLYRFSKIKRTDGERSICLA